MYNSQPKENTLGSSQVTEPKTHKPTEIDDFICALENTAYNRLPFIIDRLLKLIYRIDGRDITKNETNAKVSPASQNILSRLNHIRNEQNESIEIIFKVLDEIDKYI
jgi:hypothetical protein